MKKFLTLIFTFLILVSSNAAYAAEGLVQGSFSDIPNGHPNFVLIEFLHSIGIIDGYPDGTFRPDGEINRAELMKIVIELDLTVDPVGENCFPDVIDEWFAPFVCAAEALGWVNGYPDGTFKPAQFVNRAEAIKMVLNSFYQGEENVFDPGASLDYRPADLDRNEWYYKFVANALFRDVLYKNHVTENEDGSFNYLPGGNMSREEVAFMVANLIFIAEAYPAELALFTDDYNLLEVYPAGVGAPSAEVFNSNNEDFVVDFPDTPLVYYEPIVSQFDTEAEMKLFIYENESEQYIVSFVDTGINIADFGERAFELVRWGMFEDRLIEFTTFIGDIFYGENGENPGTEYVFEDIGDKEYFGYRMVFVGERFYQLLYLNEGYDVYPEVTATTTQI